MSRTFLVKFYSPVCIAWNNNYPVPVCLVCRRTPSIKSFVLGVIICPVLSVLKFDLRSRDEVFIFVDQTVALALNLQLKARTCMNFLAMVWVFCCSRTRL